MIAGATGMSFTIRCMLIITARSHRRHRRHRRHRHRCLRRHRLPPSQALAASRWKLMISRSHKNRLGRVMADRIGRFIIRYGGHYTCTIAALSTAVGRVGCSRQGLGSATLPVHLWRPKMFMIRGTLSATGRGCIHGLVGLLLLPRNVPSLVKRHHRLPRRCQRRRVTL